MKCIQLTYSARLLLSHLKQSRQIENLVQSSKLLTVSLDKKQENKKAQTCQLKDCPSGLLQLDDNVEYTSLCHVDDYLKGCRVASSGKTELSHIGCDWLAC